VLCGVSGLCRQVVIGTSVTGAGRWTAHDLDDKVETADRPWQVEHRYRAVLEVRAGSPVVEVALRYGPSRQSVYVWKARFERDGLAGLEDRSRRPHHSPHRLAAEIEALVKLALQHRELVA
jgi:hypothetical protein